MTADELEALNKNRLEREKRERALAERERRVQEEKRKQQSGLVRGRHLLREGEAEIEEAMRVSKEGIRSYLEVENQDSVQVPQEKSPGAS
jgi:hypothetical protein